MKEDHQLLQTPVASLVPLFLCPWPSERGCRQRAHPGGPVTAEDAEDAEKMQIWDQKPEGRLGSSTRADLLLSRGKS